MRRHHHFVNAVTAAAALALTSNAHAETRLPECAPHGMAPGLLSKPGVSKVCRVHFPNGSTTLCGATYPVGGIVCIIETSGK